MLRSINPFEDLMTWLAEMIISDEYLERREREWREADEREFYLS
jgi:hypothetical protein